MQSQRRHALGTSAPGRILLMALALAVALAPFASSARAQEMSSVYSFGPQPVAALGELLQTREGVYVTARAGGLHDRGAVVYRPWIGRLRVLHSFDYAEGIPIGGVVEGGDGALYGVTNTGGAHGHGIAYRLTKRGALTVLHAFTRDEGGPPSNTLLRANDGNFYGTTAGVYNDPAAVPWYAWQFIHGGSVFRMTPSGTVTILHAFSGKADGAQPRAPLIQSRGGDLYGTTSQLYDTSSIYYYPYVTGTVFRVSLGGAFTTLANLTEAHADPQGRLVEGESGVFYGTAAEVGRRLGVSYSGSVFRVTATGEVTDIHTFGRYAPGGFPPPPPDPAGMNLLTGLIPASDGGFYGTTNRGGANDLGTIFHIAPAGSVRVLHDFEADEGSPPWQLSLTPTGALLGTSPSTIFRASRLGAAWVENRVGSPHPYGRPNESLLFGDDGFLYGTTTDGMLFRLSLDGRLTPLATLPELVNTAPNVIIQGDDGALYTLARGPRYGLLRIARTGAATLVASSEGTGWRVSSNLLQADDGTFVALATDEATGESRAIVRLTVTGETTPLHVFDGAVRSPHSFVRTSAGAFYGTAFDGGPGGSVFHIDRAGVLTVVHAFPTTQVRVTPGLVELGGAYYGSTSYDYDETGGLIFRVGPDTPFEVVHSFEAPGASLYQGIFDIGNLVAVGDTLYGRAREPGYYTLFRLSADGSHEEVLKVYSGAVLGLVEGADSLFGVAFVDGRSPAIVRISLP
jgi:uncharacterized repeat protein (TIGR03803 family)